MLSFTTAGVDIVSTLLLPIKKLRPTRKVIIFRIKSWTLDLHDVDINQVVYSRRFEEIYNVCVVFVLLGKLYCI